MIEEICQVWLSKNVLVKMDWGDSFCQSCIQNWVTTSMKKYKLKMHESIKWLNHQCLSQWTFQQLFDKLNKEVTDEIWAPRESCPKINDTYLELYINSTADMVSCPRANCSYVGFISQKTCSEAFECGSCGYTWRMANQMSFYESTELY